jgi:hypothetical protein
MLTFPPCLSHPQCPVRGELACLGFRDDTAQTSEGNRPDLARLHEPGKLIEHWLLERHAEFGNQLHCEIPFRFEQAVRKNQVLCPTTTS